MRTFAIAALVGTVTASPSIMFDAGDAPICTVGSDGETLVQYTNDIHPSFKCTHTSPTTCACTHPHPTHHTGQCKQFDHYGTGKTHDAGGDCSESGKNAIDGGWSVWTAGSCSKTCGAGTEVATRTCTSPAPFNGGAQCAGSATKTESCNNGPCPVDGTWSSYGAWGSCSATCGGGTQTRTRTCDGRAHGGDDCVGSATDSRDCNTQACGPSCGAAPAGSFPILFNTHNHGPHATGNYGHFDIAAVDALVGSTTWHNADFKVRNMRTGSIGKAVLWRSPNRPQGVSTEGHLRWNGSGSGQWHICDMVELMDYSVQSDAQCEAISGKKFSNEIYVRNIEHSHGWSSMGKYAHFNKGAVDAMTGRSSWSNQDFRLMNVRTGKVGTAVLWRSPNRPSSNSIEGHLRWNDGNCCSVQDWKPCDRLRLVDYNPKPEECPGTLSANEIFVHNIEHNHGRGSAGNYAHFPLIGIDVIAGRTDWSNQNFRLMNTRTGVVGTAVIWRSPNRQIVDSSEGHLRWNDGNSQDWKMCDKLRLVDYEPTQADCEKVSGALGSNEIYVTNIEHNHGRSSQGKYAHFPKSVVDAIAGRTTWSNTQFKLVNRRTNKSGIAVIWRGPNRQIMDSDEGHLRWDDGNCCSTSDWQMCDRLHIVPK